MDAKVLTIIVSYNFEPWLDKCLGSLLRGSVPNDILVVDNASKDHTVSRIKAQYPEIELIANKENLGFGRANNIGFKKAIEEGYDYVFLVNQDAWVKRDCLKKLLLADHDGAGILSPMHYDGSGNTLDSGFVNYLSKAKDKGSLLQVSFVNAAFWLVPVHILKSLGGFSPLFYHYGEDVDFTNRVIFHGFEINIVKEAVAYHDRQYRQTTEEQFFYSEFVYFLTEYCNINYGKFRSKLMSLGACLKKSMKHLAKGKVKYAKRYVLILFSLLRKSAEVAKTRKRNRVLPNENIVI